MILTLRVWDHRASLPPALWGRTGWDCPPTRHRARGRGSCPAPVCSAGPARSDQSSWTCPGCNPRQPRRKTHSPGVHRTMRSMRPDHYRLTLNANQKSGTCLFWAGHFSLERRIDPGTEEVGDSRSLEVKVGGSTGHNQDTVSFFSISEPCIITEINIKINLSLGRWRDTIHWSLLLSRCNLIWASLESCRIIKNHLTFAVNKVIFYPVHLNFNLNHKISCGV